MHTDLLPDAGSILLIGRTVGGGLPQISTVSRTLHTPRGAAQGAQKVGTALAGFELAQSCFRGGSEKGQHSGRRPVAPVREDEAGRDNGGVSRDPSPHGQPMRKIAALLNGCGEKQMNNISTLSKMAVPCCAGFRF